MNASRHIEIAPSILTADFGRLTQQVRAAERGGADLLHLDVMDGHFVPRITFGDPLIAAVRGATSLPIEVHMMVESPGEYFESFAEAGADRFIFHFEAVTGVSEADALISRGHRLGKQVGIAINPATPPWAVFPLLDRIDELVVMLIEPGWGGQPMQADLLSKVGLLEARSRTDGLTELPIEVDGGVKPENAAACVRAGASVLVAGSAVYNDQETPRQAISRLRRALRG
ncbi:MAG: ribulose-phosphate 3-epimerase [Chloroflexi bacterium]|nr:ribulose-phosphate 3-epimerase [Chloroflexota bacterium]